MKALLTGITGNLGYEVFLDLVERGIAVIPCVRPGRGAEIASHPAAFDEVVESDLSEGGEIKLSGAIDCIVHCAGVVHFREAKDKNEQMMRSVLRLAKQLSVPVYFSSTAFVYRPSGESTDFNNSYERDKFNAEQMLIGAGIPYALFRPAVLTGHSITGAIRNFSGFYTIARAFIVAARTAQLRSRTLRFPVMTGESNIVPVDIAAQCIGKAVAEHRRETLYITNPAPPRSAWVLDETLNFFNVRDSVTAVDMSFQEFGTLDLTEEEAAFHRFSSHFSPYSYSEHAFPSSLCDRNLIDHEYLARALTFFRDTDQVVHELKND